jgi:hypothetical protein
MSDETETRGRSRGPMIAVIVVAVALLAAGAVAALLLTGVWRPFGAAPSPSPAPTSAPATPTPTPTADTAAPVRVPLECDDVLPEDAAQTLAGTAVSREPLSFGTPLDASDVRTGSVVCVWTSDQPLAEGERYAPSVRLTIVPDVTDDDYHWTADGETYAGTPSVEGLGEPSRSYCDPGDDPYFCGMVDLVDGYGIRLTVLPSGGTVDAATAEATRQRFLGIVDAVSAASAPGPLWEPAGPDLAGATDCDGLATDEQLAALTGDPTISEYRAYEGEFAIASFRSNRQVGGYGCGWSGDSQTIVYAFVLPGGAPYFPDSSPSGDGATWTPTTGYPGEAYLSTTGTEVAVLVDSAWFTVRVSAGQEALLPALADLVVSNVQAAGPPAR